MRETFRKLGLIGIGAWALTEEKINELVKELVEKGEMTRDEGKQVVQDIIAERKSQKEEIEKKINERVHEIINQTDLATKDDIKRLELRIEALEKSEKTEDEW
ncbi:conserved hypothetical protein [Methanosalsum zhilinae DSM 4017]|uniref:Polyhydroxyalkanoate synthesis regulator phasin n=1 Tax=Methanosalsum zhilinae (strain DSM 4017 / NBRC 107636 / OCM 62 / WeN5) TaxID=679901 RepID=F7XPB5_METZD|nr:phasin family protein [Methanosalsum zhilinae]AEH60242.1 conserved hypothetical protein [Methanosalsum zhilinae DSM 4017]